MLYTEMKHVLIIEDEVDIAELIAFNMERAGFKTHVANDGLSGIKAILEHTPDIIILDVMMPKMDGTQVLKAVRNDPTVKHIPIIMLTAKGQTEDKIKALEDGVDDYITKPFSPKELVLRVQTVLKRSDHIPESADKTSSPPFSFNKNTLHFYINEEVIDLTSTEFKLMLFLCKNVNVVQDRQSLLKEVWGYHEDVNSRTLDTHMKRLRKKLGNYAHLLITVRGAGYKIVSEETK